ncbi:MAG: hypothetical protein N4A72_15015 [Bacteroidales bacterium]|jgi:hypothetical protein|nr:hypothetical protein [Bacteroidales bacterium]
MDYLEILKDINYFSFVTAFVKWVLLSLSISLIALIICAYIGLFERRTKIARYLVKIYYILIPIYFVVFAIKYAPIKNLQIEINNSIDENKEVISDFTYKFVSTVVSDSLLRQESSVKDIVNNYLDYYVSTTDSVNKPQKSMFLDGFFTKIRRKIEYSFLVIIVESEIIERLSQWVGVSKKTGKELYQTDFNKLFKEGELVEIFKNEINKYFRGYFRFTFLIFSLGLLIPVIEIILAKVIRY